ncbi:nitrate reductase [Pseudoneurospora amorphoporcata]|uniref:Nitrate reductase n=1 Tax=Pseudoneurospora amorphoporcata TaxID=241081 RepID=A0AAN6NL10_9PEZI|nr:nitrate reductase [Pseudoneurospora amorphoporcata]
MSQKGVRCKVYDATSVLNWHPGGRAAILAHAGKCRQETTNEFVSIHDDFAWKKLHECILGRVTDKTANFIRKSAEAAAKEKSEQSQDQKDLALQRRRWNPVKLINRRQVSPDTNTYTFRLPEGKAVLGLSTCQHLQIGFHLREKMLIRQYTPTRPLLPAAQNSQGHNYKSSGTHNHKSPKHHVHTGSHRHQDKQQASRRSETIEEVTNYSLIDGQSGSFDLTVKTYFPSPSQPGGALSNILDCLPLGSEVEIRGPTGDILYHRSGKFPIKGRDRHYSRVSLVLGGSGVTPGYTLIARILIIPGDTTEIRVVDANRTEHDILLKEELDKLEQGSGGQLKIQHVLSQAGGGWEGARGKVDERILRRSLFQPADNNVALLCGPPGLIQGVVLPALKDWGYVEDENLFGF